MPEETAPQPTPNILDKPVLNPMAKNPNFFTHKVLAAVGIILLITIAIVSGILWYVSRNSPKPTAETTTKTVNLATASAKTTTTSATKDVKAGWKTYTNTKYKFSITYPSDYEVFTHVEGAPWNDEIINIANDKLLEPDYFFGISVAQETKTLAERKQELLTDKTVTVTNMSDTKVDGKEAIKYTLNDYVYILTVANGYQYGIDLGREDSQPIYPAEEVLSNFKFL